MTLLFADGFEDGSTAWTLTNATLGTGRSGNGVVSSVGTNGRAETGITPTLGPIIAGFAVKPVSSSAGAIGALANGTSANIGLNRNGAGGIDVFRFAVGTIIASTAAGVLPAGAWSYVEVKATSHASTGTVVVRVNGIQVLSLTGQNTGGTLINNFMVGHVNNTLLGNAYDDVYIADTTGSVNNDFIGDVIVEHLRPVADDTAQWLGSDGNSTNNYDLVDEAGAFNSADYVASATVGQRDLYTIGASSKPSAAAVAGVIAVAVAMKTDAGARGVKLDLKEGSGGTVRSSAELGLPTTFGEISAVFDRKADGSAWTVADVNALRIGYEVST